MNPTTLIDFGPAMSEDGTWYAQGGHNVPLSATELDDDPQQEGYNGWVRFAPQDNSDEPYWVECTADEDGAEAATIWAFPDTTPTEPPANCTCLWTHTESFGAVYIAEPSCPAKPHPRTYSRNPN